MIGDLVFAVRQWKKHWLVLAATVATIAIGIGTNAVLFTITHAIFGRPAPGIRHADGLVRLMGSHVVTRRNGARHFLTTTFSHPDVDDIAARRDLFAGVAAWKRGFARVDFGAGMEPAEVDFVSPNFFRILETPFAVGSDFSGTPTGVPQIILSYATWRDRFGSDRAIVGRTITIAGAPSVVAGVANKEFRGVNGKGPKADMWALLASEPQLTAGVALRRFDRTDMTLEAVARRQHGAMDRDIARALDSLSRRIAADEPAEHASFAIAAPALRNDNVSAQSWERAVIRTMFLLIGGLILALTTSNVGGLLSARAIARDREIAIRRSLGATRARVVRQMLTEGAMLGLLGAVAAIVIYFGAFNFVSASYLEAHPQLKPDALTALYAFALSLAMSVAFALAPALRATRESSGSSSMYGRSMQRGQSRLQAGFVIAQVAISQPILIAIAMSLATIRPDDLWARGDRPPDNVVSMLVTGVTDRPAQRADSAFTLARLRQAIVTVPGVERASFDLTGRSLANARIPVEVRGVGPDYFAMSRLKLVRGDATNDFGSRPGRAVAVVSDSVAAALWPGTSALGQRLRLISGEDVQVIGVVTFPADAERKWPTVFLPVGDMRSFAEYGRLVVQTTGPSRGLVAAVGAPVRRLAPELAIVTTTIPSEVHDAQRADAALAGTAALAVSVAVMGLAAIGLFGLVAFSVTQRNRETAIRLALGEEAGSVVRLFFRRGMRLAFIGSAIGIVPTVLVIAALRAKIPNFTPLTALPFLIAVLLLVGTTAAATWLPARRAARANPARLFADS